MTGFTFGSNNQNPSQNNSGFSFGGSTTNTNTNNQSGGFTFGSNNATNTGSSSGFSFGGSSANPPSSGGAGGFSFGSSSTNAASNQTANLANNPSGSTKTGGFSFGGSNLNQNTNTASNTTGFSFGSSNNQPTTIDSSVASPSSAQLQLKNQFDFTTAAEEPKKDQDLLKKGSLGGISIIKPSETELINKHREKLCNELLPSELIRSIHELEKNFIESDEISIYLQNAFNLHSHPPTHPDEYENKTGILSSLQNLDEIDKTCDLLLSKCIDQQKDIDSTAHKLGDQHSILSLSSRRMGISDFSVAPKNESIYSSRSVYNINDNQLIDVDLGKTIDSYFTNTLIQSEKLMNTCNDEITKLTSISRSLLYSPNADNFANHALHHVQSVSSQISSVQAKFESKVIKDRIKSKELSDNQKNIPNSIQQHINSIFNRKKNDDAKVNDDKKSWWKDSLPFDLYNTPEGPTPFSTITPFDKKDAADQDGVNQKSSKHVTFI